MTEESRVLKVVLATSDRSVNYGMRSVVVTEMDDGGRWKNKTLSPFQCPWSFCLAAQGDWIIAAWHIPSRHDGPSHFTVAFWHGEQKLPDLILPAKDSERVAETMIEGTKVILILHDDSARCSQIRVYNMETTSTKLVKRIDLKAEYYEVYISYSKRLVSNSFFLGLRCNDKFFLYEKRKLLDLPEDTRAKQLNLPVNSPVHFNSTYIVWAEYSDPGDYTFGNSNIFLMDFWMGLPA